MSFFDDSLLDEVTLFYTNLEDYREEKVRELLELCAKKANIQMPKVVIKSVAKKIPDSDELEYPFGYVNCINSELYRTILNLDEEFFPIESEEHLLGTDVFVKENDYFITPDKGIVFKRYDGSYFYSDECYTNLLSSIVNIEDKDEEELKKVVKNISTPFSTMGKKFPKVYITYSKTRKYLNIKFHRDTNDGIFFLPFFKSLCVNVNKKDINLLFVLSRRR